ncbi:PorT family protein [bacterium]|nr:PorT family protein [bacterium]
MKRSSTLSTILILISLAGTATAQFSIGARLGMNMANIDMGSTEKIMGNFGFRMGLNLGAVFEMPVGPIILESGLIFNQTGSNYKETIDEALFKTTETINVRGNYLSIPILAKFKKPIKNFTLYGIAGPTVNFFIGGSAKGSITGDLEMDIDVDIKNYTHSTAMALVLGVGASKKINGKTFFADIRYTMGLNNIITGDVDNVQWGFIADLEATNKIIALNVGVLGLLTI